MTLYDRLMIETPRPCFGDSPFQGRALLEGAHVVEASDVARFFWDRMPENNQTNGGIQYQGKVDARKPGQIEVNLDDWFGFKWADMGNVLPPFDDTFFEFRLPQPYPMKRANGKGSVNCTQMGVMVSCFGKAALFDSEQPVIRSGMRLDSTLKRLGIAEQMTYALLMVSFLVREGEGLQGPNVTWLLPLDEDGCMFLDDNEQPILEWMPPRSAVRHDDALVRHYAQVIGSMGIIPSLMAAQVMNTPEQDEWHTRINVEPNRSQQRKYERRNGRPMVSFTEIKIGGIKAKVAEREAKTGKRESLSAVMRALHDVRRHTRTYRVSFFGSKLNPKTGRPLSEDPYTVVVPPHQRGNAAAGRRDHSYKVSPREEESA